MDKRRQDLNNIRDYIYNTDKELTLLLHNLQWDHKHILEKPTPSSCSIDPSHRIPEASRNVHEQRCLLTRHGYAKDEEFLPDPPDIATNTVVKLSTQDIQNIINAAAYNDPSFKRRGRGTQGPEALTLDRLQTTYTTDERRVIHDAVVNAAPFVHDLADLALGSNTQEGGQKSKSRAEVMAELRDMRRRRTKYRVPSKTTNYSHVLKGVIKSQMDLYADTNGIFIKTEYGPKSFVSLNDKQSMARVILKRERITPEPQNTRNMRAQDKDRHSSHQHEDRTSSRDKERHTDTRHMRERDARSYVSRQKHIEQNRNERRPRDCRNDVSERFGVIKQERFTPEPENIRYIRYAQDKDRHSGHQHEDRTISGDKGRHTDTRHMKERDFRSYDSRQKQKEQNKNERRPRNYRNDVDERFVVIKQERITSEPENTRNMRAQDKDMHSGHQHEDRITSKDREGHKHTRHTRDARPYDDRQKYKERNKYERRSRDYRNDADERYFVVKQERISPEPEDSRNIRHALEKYRHTGHHHEDRTSSRDKERHTHTRHMNEREARCDDRRQKHREQNKYEGRSIDYRNDADERFDPHKERRNEQRHDKYHRSKIQESYSSHYRDDSSSSSGESTDSESSDRSKEHSSSRADRDGRYDKNYQNVRVKEEKDDYYEERKKRKYN